MATDTITLSVPAAAAYARSVRMLAASLAVSNGFSVDDVEDVRMAAEEGFVYACSTAPASCEVSFELAPGRIGMDFSLGEGQLGDAADDAADQNLDLVELLLSAICDDFAVIDGGGHDVLHLAKEAGARE